MIFWQVKSMKKQTRNKEKGGVANNENTSATQVSIIRGKPQLFIPSLPNVWTFVSFFFVEKLG